MPLNPGLLLHAGAFLLAGLACFASITRLSAVSDADTRRGLRWLLLTSGGWATANAGFLLAPGTDLKLAFYIVGLIVGFATVGPWLYVCSAYSGRAYHHNPTYRKAAVGVYLFVTAIKLTNPIHQQYYTVGTASTTFPPLVVHPGPLHWVAMGLAYALAFVGYFMLLELFTAIDYDTRPMFVLIALTGSPILLDLVGATTDLLVDIAYEPLGVAAFALGVTVVYRDLFDEIQLAGERDTPVIALDQRGEIRDANRAAHALFPALRDSRGASIDVALPEVADLLESDEPVLKVQDVGTTRFYRITEAPYGTTKAGLGGTIVFSDITNTERYRRELVRQNERLETFAEMVSHDLRNPLNVAQGRLELVEEELGTDNPNVEAVDQALNRIEELIDDILTLARTGQPVDTQTQVDLATIARESWGMVDTREAALDITDDIQFIADQDRLKRLFENLFRNALDHVGPDVTVTVGALTDEPGFFVADDGPGIPEDARTQLFEAGFTTRQEGTGFGLAIVKEVVDAHGWTIDVTDAAGGGARFEIRAVEIAE